MELWTDGSVVLMACDGAGVLRLLRDGELVAEAKAPIWRRPPLAVDPAADRVWTVGLREFRLSDLTPIADHAVEVSRIAALGDGRIAILQDRNQGAMLAVGRPGQWDHEITVDWMCLEPTLTYTGHGLVVADGQAGIAARYDTALNRTGMWGFDAAEERDLIGYATAKGVLVTARWAEQESSVGWCTDDGKVSFLRDDVWGAFAVPADDDRFWLYTNFGDAPVSLVDRAGRTVAALDAYFPFFGAAAHGTGSAFVVGDTAHVYTVRADGDTLTVSPNTVPGLVEVTATYPAGTEYDRGLGQKLNGHTLANSPQTRPAADGRPVVYVTLVPVEHAPAVEEILRANGAVEVAVAETDTYWHARRRRKPAEAPAEAPAGSAGVSAPKR